MLKELLKVNPTKTDLCINVDICQAYTLFRGKNELEITNEMAITRKILTAIFSFIAILVLDGDVYHHSITYSIGQKVDEKH